MATPTAPVVITTKWPFAVNKQAFAPYTHSLGIHRADRVIQSIWQNQHLLYTYYLGDINGEQMLAHALDASGDDRFDAIKYIVSDWRYSKTRDITPEHVKKLVACLSAVARICPNARHATITRPDSAGNPLAAWYKYLADILPWQTELFHSPEAAFHWLPLSEAIPPCQDLESYR